MKGPRVVEELPAIAGRAEAKVHPVEVPELRGKVIVEVAGT